MSERYTRLFSLPQNLYAEASPVVIAAGALLKDNQTGRVLAQLKFHSLSEKRIKALTVVIYPRDTRGNALGEEIEFQYLDLDVIRDADFGQKVPIVLGNATTRAFSVDVKEVVFADNSLWPGTKMPWEMLNGAMSMERSDYDTELIRQYQLAYGQHKHCLYAAEKDLWYCDCGATNHQEETSCHCCHTEVDSFAAIDWQQLEEKKNQRLAEEKAAREAAAEKNREKARKNRKRMWIAASVIAVVAALAAAFLGYRARQEAILAQKEETYSKACRLLSWGENANYSNNAQAKELLATILDYKDAQTIHDCITMRIVDSSIDEESGSHFDYTYSKGGMPLHGPQRTYRYDNATGRKLIGRSDSMDYRYVFDDSGVLSCAYAGPNDIVEEAYQYNEQGELTGIVVSYPNGGKTLQTKAGFTVTDGRLTKYSVTMAAQQDGRQPEYCRYYEYDEEGRLVKITFTSSEMDGVDVSEFFYDENNRPIRERRMWKPLGGDNYDVEYFYGYVYAPEAAPQESQNHAIGMDDMLMLHYLHNPASAKR